MALSWPYWYLQFKAANPNVSQADAYNYFQQGMAPSALPAQAPPLASNPTITAGSQIDPNEDLARNTAGMGGQGSTLLNNTNAFYAPSEATSGARTPDGETPAVVGPDGRIIQNVTPYGTPSQSFGAALTEGTGAAILGGAAGAGLGPALSAMAGGGALGGAAAGGTIGGGLSAIGGGNIVKGALTGAALGGGLGYLNSDPVPTTTDNLQVAQNGPPASGPGSASQPLDAGSVTITAPPEVDVNGGSIGGSNPYQDITGVPPGSTLQPDAPMTFPVNPPPLMQPPPLPEIPTSDGGLSQLAQNMQGVPMPVNSVQVAGPDSAAAGSFSNMSQLGQAGSVLGGTAALGNMVGGDNSPSVPDGSGSGMLHLGENVGTSGIDMGDGSTVDFGGNVGGDGTSTLGSSPAGGSLLGSVKSFLGGDIGEILGLGNIGMKWGTALGTLGQIGQNLFAGQQLGKTANQVNQNTNPLLQPQRQPYQGMLSSMLGNPGAWMANDPFSQALSNQYRNNVIPRQVAQSGNAANVIDTQGSQFATALSGNFFNQANMLGGLGGFTQQSPASLGPTLAQLGTGQTAQIGGAIGGLGNMLGMNMGSPLAGQAGKSGSGTLFS